MTSRSASLRTASLILAARMNRSSKRLLRRLASSLSRRFLSRRLPRHRLVRVAISRRSKKLTSCTLPSNLTRLSRPIEKHLRSSQII